MSGKLGIRIRMGSLNCLIMVTKCKSKNFCRGKHKNQKRLSGIKIQLKFWKLKKLSLETEKGNIIRGYIIPIMGAKIIWHIQVPNWSTEFGPLASPEQCIPDSKYRLEARNLCSFLSQPAYSWLIIRTAHSSHVQSQKS